MICAPAGQKPLQRAHPELNVTLTRLCGVHFVTLEERCSVHWNVTKAYLLQPELASGVCSLWTFRQLPGRLFCIIPCKHCIQDQTCTSACQQSGSCMPTCVPGQLGHVTAQESGSFLTFCTAGAHSSWLRLRVTRCARRISELGVHGYDPDLLCRGAVDNPETVWRSTETVPLLRNRRNGGSTN